MNPFVEIPVIVKKSFGRKKEVTGRILIGEISCHYPLNKKSSLIILKSGASLITALDSASLDMARQVYDKMMKQNPGRTENLQIVRNDKKPDNALRPSSNGMKPVS